MLGSSDWGHVRFRTPTSGEAAAPHFAVNLDWYAGETDIDQLRQLFANELWLATDAYSDWCYRWMREVGSAGVVEAWWRQWGQWDCNTASDNDARANPRCVYYYPNGYPSGALPEGNAGFEDVDQVELNQQSGGGTYVIWDLITERGSLDVDGDLIDYNEDNCPEAANADQVDLDGDGVGAACDCDDSNPHCGGDCTDDDADAYCNPHDNCPSVVNSLQVDTDSDLVGDACDCDAEDPGNTAALGPTRNLRFVSKTDLEWDPPAVGDPLSYDLLRAVGAAEWTNPTCVETDIAGTTASDDEPPAGAFFYLVRVRAACGENTGTSSDEQRRQAAACAPPSKRVFVTSATYTGNLGGLAGADARCQQAADAASLPGTFKAWLSDDTTSAATRLTHSTLPYVRVDGVQVADDWTDLADGTLDNWIVIDENGAYRAGEVWTGTNPSGGAVPGQNCSGWTVATTVTAQVGLADGTNEHWTQRYLQFCNRTNVRLYCLEQ